MSERIETPVYAKIALDMAGKIAAGELAEGEKISGRSGLAGLYRVSPETIRRAIQLLEDIDIVRTRAGSGIYVVSRSQALQYVKRHHLMTDFRTIRDEIRQLTRQKEEIESRIKDLITLLEEQADRLQNVRPVYPYEIAVPADSPLIGKTINDSKFWQNTGGTIVAIQRGPEIINSPGPYALFLVGDILLITGDAGVDARSRDYLKNG
jgi:K+/H+ antiporter YhaU regulatory subunit KhtT